MAHTRFGRKAMHAGKRTCIGCHTRKDPNELLRFNLVGGSLVCVPEGRPRTGRGVSLCPDRQCVRRAIKSRAFARAFRTSNDVFQDLCVDKVLAEALNAYKTRLVEVRGPGGPGHEVLADSLNNMIIRLEQAIKE